MTREHKPKDEAVAFDIAISPDVRKLAEEVERTRKPASLKRGDKEIAKVVPVKETAKTATTSRRRRQPIPKNDPLFKLIGMFDSHGPGDVGEHVDEYLAEAIYSEFHPAQEK